jgi:hypothetical protein
MTNRRTILKRLVALPFVGASVLSISACKHQQSEAPCETPKLTGPQLHPCDPTLAGYNNPGLNIFLHGLFLLSVQNGRFDLFSPNVSGHAYTAGTWKNEQTLNQSSTILLTGINPGTKPAFSANENFIVPAATAAKLVPSTNYFGSFQLPFPDATHAPKLRRQLPKPHNFNFLMNGAGFDDLGMRPGSVPLIYVFTYPASQFTNGSSGVQLLMNGSPVWSFTPNSTDPLSYDLHIHAEPSACPNAQHLDDAYDALNMMFNPKLTLKLNVPEASIGGAQGCDEDQSLAEQNGSCKKTKGGEPANCTGFILGG